MKTRILSAILLVFWATLAIAQNNVGIGTANPAAKLDVQGNGIGYDVFNASNDKTLPLDSMVIIDSRGRLGIGTTFTGTYNLLSHGHPAAFSPQLEVWQGDPYTPGSLMLGDIVDIGAPLFNGALNLYLTGNKNVAIQALGNSYLNGGNLGIGVVNPLEILHLNGAIVLSSLANAGGEIPGTIEWNGVNFVGWNGPGLPVFLDGQADNDWQMIPSGYVPPVMPPPNNPELVPMTPPSSLSMSYPGDPNQGGIVWIPDRPLPGVYPHQLMLESTTNALQSDASMLFRMSDWSLFPQNPPLLIDDYCLGIFRGDMSFKLYRGSILTATTQGDIFSMFRANASGIIDLPNQSRVRAMVTNFDWASWQLIQPNTWTPVNYTSPIPGSPLFPGAPMWDEQSEYTSASSPNQPILGNNPNSFFTAQEEGFYQVNARCEFEPDDYMEEGLMFPVYMRPNAYVSIAVYIEVAGGPVQWIPHAIGNNLQVTNNVFIAGAPPEYPDATAKMTNNNAPNVSDVVYLRANDRVSIWVFHWAYTPMMIRVGDGILYFSIHKIS
jgi:hypothetical protein